MRYQVHDEEGVLRTFSRKEEAVAFMATRPELKLVVVKQQRRISWTSINLKKPRFNTILRVD